MVDHLKTIGIWIVARNRNFWLVHFWWDYLIFSQLINLYPMLRQRSEKMDLLNFPLFKTSFFITDMASKGFFTLR